MKTLLAASDNVEVVSRTEALHELVAYTDIAIKVNEKVCLFVICALNISPYYLLGVEFLRHRHRPEFKR